MSHAGWNASLRPAPWKRTREIFFIPSGSSGWLENDNKCLPRNGQKHRGLFQKDSARKVERWNAGMGWGYAAWAYMQNLTTTSHFPPTETPRFNPSLAKFVDRVRAGMRSRLITMVIDDPRQRGGLYDFINKLDCLKPLLTNKHPMQGSANCPRRGQMPAYLQRVIHIAVFPTVFMPYLGLDAFFSPLPVTSPALSALPNRERSMVT
ncbi:hypothetical protein L249_1768 [Ophiocordyceps polyrhachis-furcata BCC 54312]|uniref:Uncharacterized protein n=1 Tax=Ophiocordyceps polyrhachis-furcata BCC 54312 TaxID=1330021 RepID=A0A367LNU0_9HYPO|nr:hypothetical protein L249_1768 [Ophiocordyceps polyrhachis-furcata BCC 54312]